MQKRIKCDVCGYRFIPLKGFIYTVEDTLSLAEVLSTARKVYNAQDCPRCGCQKLLQEIKPKNDCPAKTDTTILD